MLSRCPHMCPSYRPSACRNLLSSIQGPLLRMWTCACPTFDSICWILCILTGMQKQPVLIVIFLRCATVSTPPIVLVYPTSKNPVSCRHYSQEKNKPIKNTRNFHTYGTDWSPLQTWFTSRSSLQTTPFCDSCRDSALMKRVQPFHGTTAGSKYLFIWENFGSWGCCQ